MLTTDRLTLYPFSIELIRYGFAKTSHGTYQTMDLTQKLLITTNYLRLH